MLFGELPGGLLGECLRTAVDIDRVAIRCEDVLARGVSPVWKANVST